MVQTEHFEIEYSQLFEKASMNRGFPKFTCLHNKANFFLQYIRYCSFPLIFILLSNSEIIRYLELTVSDLYMMQCAYVVLESKTAVLDALRGCMSLVEVGAGILQLVTTFLYWTLLAQTIASSI